MAVTWKKIIMEDDSAEFTSVGIGTTPANPLHVVHVIPDTDFNQMAVHSSSTIGSHQNYSHFCNYMYAARTATGIYEQAITAFADAGGGQVTVTSNSHGISTGANIVISGTTNYNGGFVVANAQTNTFEITDTWNGDDATGIWELATAFHNLQLYTRDLGTATGQGIYSGIIGIFNYVSEANTGGNADLWGCHHIIQLEAGATSQPYTFTGVGIDVNILANYTSPSGGLRGLCITKTDVGTGASVVERGAAVYATVIDSETNSPWMYVLEGHGNANQVQTYLHSDASGATDIQYKVGDADTNWHMGLNIGGVGAGYWSLYDGEAAAHRIYVNQSGAVYMPVAYSSSAGGGREAFIEDNGLLGVDLSARRYKTNIRKMEDTSWIYDLKPVNFSFKTSPDKKRYGLIAEDVEKVCPEMMFHNNKGKAEGIHRSLFTFPLINEIQKLRKRIEKLESA